MSLKISSFQELLKTHKMIPRFEKGTNTVKFIAHNGKSNDKKISVVSTDMIDNIDFYVRIIMNVQLFEYKDINTLKSHAASVVEEFKAKFAINSNYVNIRTSGNGNSYIKNVEVITWVTVDIPFVHPELASVNETIKSISSMYKQICTDRDINGEENFIIAKFIANVNYIKKDGMFTGVMIANFQKPNNNVQNIKARVSIPSSVNYGEIKNFDNTGCNLGLLSDIDFSDEIVFDDRVKICEFNVNRFVKKTETQSFPQISSRIINIVKKNKNVSLIKNIDGNNIEVGAIDFTYYENPKAICVIDEYITAFLTSSSRLGIKTIKSIAHIIGKNITNKVMKKLNEVESEL